MKIITYKPKNEKLKKYIDFFYILTHSKEEGKTRYFTFPNTSSMVSFASNMISTRNKNFIGVKPFSAENLNSELDVKYTSPLLIQYEGDIKEITISFKTLGINVFLDKPLNTYCKNDFSFFPFNDFRENIQRILNLNSNDKAIENLEKYLLTKLIPKSFITIQKIIDDVIDNPDTSISIIAKNHNISHKTLISYFNKHICKTPSDFRKIIRFRKSLENSDTKNLTELSYLSDYFDQSHMIKDFKKLTKYTPKEFFEKLSIMDVI